MDTLTALSSNYNPDNPPLAQVASLIQLLQSNASEEIQLDIQEQLVRAVLSISLDTLSQPSFKSTLTSSLLPQLVKLNPSASLHQIWSTLSLANTSSLSVLRQSTLILVHLFPFFFSLSSVSSSTSDTASAPSTPSQSQQKKKYNRKDATIGITTGASFLNEHQDHDSLSFISTTTTSTSTPGPLLIDLRKSNEFWLLIQAGLASTDPSIEKSAVFLVKRVLDFCDRVADGVVNLYFTHTPSKTTPLFKLYLETLQILSDPSPHLATPLLPRIPLFHPPEMHISWTHTLLHRALKNHSAPMRKRVLLHILTTNPPIDPHFLCTSVMPELDAASLYNVSGLGSVASPFGDRVRVYMRGVLGCAPTLVSRVVRACVGFSTRVACVFVLLGVCDFAGGWEVRGRGGLLEWGDVKGFAECMESERAVSVWTKLDARKLFCRLAVTITVKLCDMASISFKDLRYLLSVIGPSEAETDSFKEVQEWCLKGFGEGWLSKECKQAIKSFLETVTGVPESEVKTAESLVKMLAFIPTKSLKDTLEPLFARLQNLHASSSYAPEGTSNRVIFLLAEISSNFTNALSIFFSNTNLFEIKAVCLHKLAHPIGTPFKVIEKYAMVLQHVLRLLPQPMQALITLHTQSMRILSNTELTQTTLFTAYTTINLAYTLANALGIQLPTVLPISTLLTQPKYIKSPTQESWSDIQTDLQIAQYSCLASLLAISPTNQTTEILETLANEIENTSTTSTPPLLHCAHLLLQRQPLKDPTPIPNLLKNSLEILLENTGNAKHFTQILSHFSQLAFTPQILASSNPQIHETVHTAFSALKDLANQRIGIMEHVATPFLSAWESAHPAHLDIFITLLSFGPTRDKNMDADRVDAAISYILHTAPIPSPPNLSKETAELNFNCRDYAIRVRANAVLLRNRDPEVSVRVLEALVGEMESGMWKAKFDNTHEHRMQIRIWSSIHLVIEDIPNNKDWADRIVRLLDLDVVASTRYYLEWAVMRVFLKYPGMVESVWSWLDRFDAKSTTLCSILSVLLHTLPHQPEAIQSHLYSTLFTKITPWLTSNHFTIRLYAQYVLFTLWNHCEAPYLQTVKTTHSYLSSLVNFIQSNHDCIKHRQQVAKAFFVGGGFDPTLDLSVDFVFRWGWRALGVTEEERISAHAFQRVGLKEEDSRIPLFSDKSRIALIESQSPVTSDDDTSIPEEPTPTATTDLTALQRKFEPWETMLETDFDFSPSLAREANVRKRFPLIVVASLVSKSPNLGGLCRTCEIFNAEMLVLPTLKVVEDPAFLVTAVTSEKWMPMMEIRPDPSVLLPYLSAKKLEGYSILGIEQATTSVSLDTFEFPQKCVLLLGMEKLGIPAVYMPLLDYILEIPQYGVIRSLNVHVSGALVLANFAKQQKAV